MVILANDCQLRTVAEKPGTPTERSLVIRTLAEKNGATGGTQGPPTQAIMVT